MCKIERGRERGQGIKERERERQRASKINEKIWWVFTIANVKHCKIIKTAYLSKSKKCSFFFSFIIKHATIV